MIQKDAKNTKNRVFLHFLVIFTSEQGMRDMVCDEKWSKLKLEISYDLTKNVKKHDFSCFFDIFCEIIAYLELDGFSPFWSIDFAEACVICENHKNVKKHDFSCFLTFLWISLITAASAETIIMSILHFWVLNTIANMPNFSLKMTKNAQKNTKNRVFLSIFVIL